MEVKTISYNDKRKADRYIFLQNGTKISPEMTYNESNIFLLGYKRGYEQKLIMWEYTTKEIKIGLDSSLSIDDKLNELGKYGWEVFSILSEPYYDNRLQIGKYKIQSATIHTVILKRRVE